MTAEIVGHAHLRDFPLLIWRRQQEYTQDLMREFQLLTLDPDRSKHEFPRRLLEVAETFVSRYGTYSAGIADQREAALAAEQR